MAFIRNIDSTPLFSTKKEATKWGKQNFGISGFHSHKYAGSYAFMAGSSHAILKEAQLRKFKNSTEGEQRVEIQVTQSPPLTAYMQPMPTPVLPPPPPVLPPTPPPPPTPPATSGGYSGGGGGGGGGGGY